MNKSPAILRGSAAERRISIPITITITIIVFYSVQVNNKNTNNLNYEQKRDALRIEVILRA